MAPNCLNRSFTKGRFLERASCAPRHIAPAMLRALCRIWCAAEDRAMTKAQGFHDRSEAQASAQPYPASVVALAIGTLLLGDLAIALTMFGALG
jgi:hypothetical protein